MKKFILIIAFSFCFQGLFAQSDTIYPIVTGNQVCIHNDSSWQNCAFSPGLEYLTINDSIINWYQIDTIAVFFGCNCWFNYSVTIDSLNPGNYYVFVYSGYNSATFSDTTYVGSTNFTITEQTECDSIVHLSSSRTDCLLTSLNNNPISEEQYILEQNSSYISIISKGQKKIINAVIYKLTGQLIFMVLF